MQTATKAKYQPTAKSDLQTLFSKREEIVDRLSRLNAEKRQVEREMVKEMVDRDLLDCLSINWSRLHHSM